MLRSTTIVALCAFAAPAYGFTDTPFHVGATSSDNVNDRALKFNQYDVNETVMLQELEVYLEPMVPGCEGVFAVYEEGGGFGGGWDLLWDSGTVLLTPGQNMKSSGSIGVPLEQGRSYMIGYFMIDDTAYFHGDVGSEDLGWAVINETLFNTGNTFGGLPDRLDWGLQSANSHYRQRITVGIADDLDGDGANEIVDCDDSDATRFPGADELCDEIDNNCNGEVDENVAYHDVYEDADGDGFGVADGAVESVCEPDPPAGFANDVGDCDDNNDQINPEMEELCDGLDNNCDDELGEGEVDLDGDGAFACEDCDDADPESFPGQTETCNGVDNDCDGDAPTEDNCDIDDFSEEELVIGACACNQANPGGALPAMSLLLLAGLIRRRRV